MMTVMVFALSSPQMGHAGEAESVKQVFSSIPMPCAEEATRLLNQQLLRMSPDQILNGIQQASDISLTPGSPSHSRARMIITKALALEEKADGPLFKFNLSQVLNGIASTWSAEEKSYYASFFSSPSGKLYLTDILDGATCAGWLKSANSPPFPAFNGEDKERWDALMARLKGGEERFLIKLRQLSKEERQCFEAGYKKLDRVFDVALMQIATRQDAILKARVEKALHPHVAEISKIINAP